MTSKLTREQLHERARENVKALKMASRQHAFESAREEILADLQLAELALAAMDSEAKEPISFDEWSRKCALQITLCHSDFREKAQYIWDSARATHQPAPVVPEDVLDALQKVARIRLDLNGFDGDRRGIADCLGDAEEALIKVVNRLAAILQELQKSAGTANNCRSSENVQAENPTKWWDGLYGEIKGRGQRSEGDFTPDLGMSTEDIIDFINKSHVSDAGNSPAHTGLRPEQCGVSPVIPDGYVMVPKEVTPEIGNAINEVGHHCTCGNCSQRLWDLLLAASPQEVSDGK